jgi:1,2-phenylacetyl-CoA epoxidase catalytic subunit
MSFDPGQVKGFQILEEIGIRALDDPVFRQQLIDHPEDELRKAGLEVPKDVKIVVHENTDQELHLVLPGCKPPQHEVNVVRLFCAFHWI